MESRQKSSRHDNSKNQAIRPMSLGRILRAFCPPALLGACRTISGRSVRYSGDFESWAEAATNASGYDSEVILRRVAEATRKVMAGEAAFERDSVLFDRMIYPFHLLAPMLRAALEANGRLSVLDYGGSLGSTYRLCRPFLGPIALTWNVVEQSSFVTLGKAEFETEELYFFESIEDIPDSANANVALFSSSLQYLKEPYASLRLATENTSCYLILDRTPFASTTADHICVQHVPRNIYPCSYPMWIFAYERFKAILSDDWSLMAKFVGPEGEAICSGHLKFEFRGLIFRRINIESLA